MTAIVGLIDTKNDDVWLGGDYLATYGESTESLSIPKIYRKGCMLVGDSGLYRVSQSLMYDWKPPPPPGPRTDPYKWMCTKVAPGLTKLMEKVEDISWDEMRGCELLVAFRKKLFVISLDCGEVLEPQFPFTAIGSGRPYALGALHATDRIKDPIKRIQLALEAAEEYDPGVRRASIGPPWKILSLKGKEA